MVSAQAAFPTTEIERYLATTVWVNYDAVGNTIYTQLSIQVGFNVWELGGPGTEMFLYRDVVNPEGEFLYTDDSFFGHLTTSETVFYADPKLKYASLDPVTFEGNHGPYTIQVEWTVLDDIWGDLRITSSSFKISDPTSPDRYQVKYQSEIATRYLVATGVLNGKKLEDPYAYGEISRDTSAEVTKGYAPYLLSLTDYYAPTFEQGNKLMRGGEGSSAEATWITQNPNGTTSEMTLYISEGFEQELRLKYFFEGTSISLTRIARDQDGNWLSYDSGGIFTTGDIVNISQNLDRASLPPVTITICGYWERDSSGECINGEDMQIQAEFSGTEKLMKWDRWRYTEVTNCDDVDCWTADFLNIFKVKVLGSGAGRSVTATGTLNGVDLGPSTLDEYGQGAGLFYIREYEIQYGGEYPLNVFPIQTP